MCLTFISIMYFSKKFQELKVYEWDQQTVTAGDYTCEMEIPSQMWENFLADGDNVATGQSKGEAFKNYLLKTLPDLLFQDWRQKQSSGEEERHIPREEMNIAVV